MFVFYYVCQRLAKLDKKRRRQEENRLAWQMMVEEKKAFNDRIFQKTRAKRDEADVRVRAQSKLEALQNEMDSELEEKLKEVKGHREQISLPSLRRLTTTRLEVKHGGREVGKKEIMKSLDPFSRTKLNRLKKEIREETAPAYKSSK